MWPDVEKVLNQHRSEFMGDKKRFNGCPKLVGSLRWFWVAQMSHQFEGQPEIVSFDLNRLSYYSFRDDLANVIGCPITIIGSKRHYHPASLQKFVTIDSEREMVLESHKDRVAIVVNGRVLAAPTVGKATYY